MSCWPEKIGCGITGDRDALQNAHPQWASIGHLTRVTCGLPRHVFHGVKTYRHFVEHFLFTLRLPNELVVSDSRNVFVRLACGRRGRVNDCVTLCGDWLPFHLVYLSISGAAYSAS